jgi:hypothetical protein
MKLVVVVTLLPNDRASNLVSTSKPTGGVNCGVTFTWVWRSNSLSGGLLGVNV